MSRLLVSAASTAFATLTLVLVTGCGPGGGSDGGGGGTLNIRARWEQPAANALKTRALPGRPEKTFGTAIPPSVNTVRITVTPSEGSSASGCCIAVPRGSQAFINRRLVIGSLPAGDVLVRISGYPGNFAPSDGIGGDCVTVPSGAGASCVSGRSAPPSFASDDVPVTVVAGSQSSTGDVSINSLPFLLDVSPTPGTLVNVPDVPISFAVVSANNTILPGSIDVSLQAGNPPQAFDATINSTVACDDRGQSGTRCTNGPDIDVAGFLVGAVSDTVPAGPARILIDAQDNAGRSVNFGYDVNVQPGATTTLPPTTTTLPPTTSTTPSSSTTQTTIRTTTTTSPTITLPPSSICVLAIGVTTSEVLTGVEYTVNYASAQGRFQRPNEGPVCVSVIPTVLLVQNTNDETNRILRHQLNSSTPFTSPNVLTECLFFPDQETVPTASDFPVTLVGAVDDQGRPVTPTVDVLQVVCVPFGTSTTGSVPTSTAPTSTVTTSTVTTTTVSTTTTTLPTVTTTSTTTTTSGSVTTTTTFQPQGVCVLGFAVTNTETIERIDFEVNYSTVTGRFTNAAEGSACSSATDAQVLVSALDNPGAHTLDARVQTPIGFSTPDGIAVCRFLAPDTAGLSALDFPVNVLSAVRPDGTAANPALSIIGFQCVPVVPTTTTTVPSNFDNCDITFGWQTPDILADLQWQANFVETGGGFAGTSNDVQCTRLVATAGQGIEEKNGILVGFMSAPSGVRGPADVARCRYVGPAPGGFEGAISISTLLAHDPTGTPTNANIQITGVTCGL